VGWAYAPEGMLERLNNEKMAFGLFLRTIDIANSGVPY
jgi:hypothetical protein